MNIIYWEILQWTVDWVNNTFSTQKNISSIIEVNIGWLPTIDYTIDWRRIIFNTAPLEWTDNPTIDYYWDEVCNFTKEDVTVNEVLIEVLDNIWIQQFSTPYPQVTAIRRIDEVFKQVSNNDWMSIFSTLSFTKWGNYRVWEIERLDLINTTSNIDNFTPRVWRAIVSWSVVEFITRTDTAFTLSDSTTFTPESWDLISVWYKLPSCVKDVIDLKIKWNSATRVEFDDFRVDNTSSIYTINDWYIYFSNTYDSENVVIKYKSNNIKFSTTSDVIDIPREYLPALSDYATWKMLQNREDERWQWIQQRRKLELRKWKAYIKRQSKWDNNIPLFNWPLNQI